MAGVLEGITVVDPSANVAGPYCTQILGDLGATVIKIERPGVGDDSRHWRPPEWREQSVGFLATNRNKRSIAVDLDRPEGQDIVRRLACSADVFVHSMKLGSMEARGLGFEALIEQNPKLVYCAISGFGERPPWASRPGYDPVVQAYSGIMSVTGHAESGPARCGVPVIDMGTGIWAALGVLAALLKRASTGRGLRVQASLMDTGLAWMAMHLLGVLAGGKTPGRMGSGVDIVVPHQGFPAADGWVLIAAPNDRLFGRVCEVLGTPELAQDPRFSSNAVRVTYREELIALMSARTEARTVADLLAALERAGVACAPIRDARAVAGDAYLDHAGMFVHEFAADLGELPLINFPLVVDGERAQTMQPPPALGEHTDDILAALGYQPGEISKLRAQGLVG